MRWPDYLKPGNPNFGYVVALVVAVGLVVTVGFTNLIGQAIAHSIWALVIGVGFSIADRTLGPKVSPYFGATQGQGLFLYNHTSRTRLWAALIITVILMTLFGGGGGFLVAILMALVMAFVMFVAFELGGLIWDNRDAIAATAREVGEGKFDHLRGRASGAATAVRDRAASAAHEAVNEAGGFVRGGDRPPPP